MNNGSSQYANRLRPICLRLAHGALKALLDWILLPWLPTLRRDEYELPSSSLKRKRRRRRRHP